MTLYPRQNSGFCMKYCCFELMLDFSIQYLTSIIQHCAFTIPHHISKSNIQLFKVNIFVVNLGSSCTSVDDIQCSTLGWLGEAFSYLWDMDVRSTVSAPKVFSGGRGQSEVVE